MIKNEFLYGMQMFHKTINVGTTDEKQVFVYQIVANGPDKVVSAGSFDSLEDALSVAGAATTGLLKSPGVVDPRIAPKEKCSRCGHEDDDDDVD